MSRTSKRPCYAALCEAIDVRDLMHPDNRFVHMANALDAAFGSQIQHAAWHKNNGRDAQEFLMVCLADTAFYFRGPAYNHMLLSNRTKVTIIPYVDHGDQPRQFISDTAVVKCPTDGTELVAFVKNAINLDQLTDVAEYTVNRWHGPKPGVDVSGLCMIL